MKTTGSKESRMGLCAFCGEFRQLQRSHAIPNAAFKEIFRSSGGQAIGIPAGDGNARKTSESGAAFLLCEEDEGLFNRQFDGPLINALKRLNNEIQQPGTSSRIEFPADQAAHAIVSIAWRICASPAKMYSQIRLKPRHRIEIDRIFRYQSSEVLKHCTVKLSNIYDGSEADEERASGRDIGRFIVAPRAFSIAIRPSDKLDRFAIDWTMFGFLFHVVVPRIPYPKSVRFGGLKLGSKWTSAKPVDIFEYKPILEVLAAASAKKAEGKLSPSLKRHQ